MQTSIVVYNNVSYPPTQSKYDSIDISSYLACKLQPSLMTFPKKQTLSCMNSNCDIIPV